MTFSLTPRQAARGSIVINDYNYRVEASHAANLSADSAGLSTFPAE
jgi:hypothetical protein